MGASGHKLGNLIRRSMIELRKDKRKAFLLAVLAIGACAALVNLLVAPSSPVKAGAAEQPAGARIAERQPDARPGESTEGDQGKSALRDRYDRGLVRKIERDIFTPNPEFSPPRQDATAVRRTVPRTTTQPGESQEAIQRQMVLAHAQSLVLQTTMISSNPTAIVNGRVMRIGDRILGFEVVEITPRACKVRKDGVTVILEMSK